MFGAADEINTREAPTAQVSCEEGIGFSKGEGNRIIVGVCEFSQLTTAAQQRRFGGGEFIIENDRFPPEENIFSSERFPVAPLDAFAQMQR